MSADLRLSCPHHSGDRVELLKAVGVDDLLECPQCDFTCPDYLTYPVRQLVNRRTGELYSKNVLTGEVVEEGADA